MEVILKHEFKRWNSVEHYDYNDILSNKKPNRPQNSIMVDSEIFSVEDNYIPKHGKWKYKSNNTSEEVFVKNYGNPCFSVHFNVITIVLEKNEDKVSLKIFSNGRHREVGRIYFNKITSLRYLTYNKKTHDLYSGNVQNYHKKRKRTSSVKRNNFYLRPLNSFTNLLNNHLNEWSNQLRINGYEKNTMIKNYIHSFLSAIGLNDNDVQRTDDFHFNGDKVLYKLNMINKGIKCPDNFEVFIEQFPLPNKKESKKNNNKLIDIMMSRHNLKGGKFKKALHKIKNFNPDFLKYSITLFGIETIKSLSDDLIVKILESNNYSNGYLYDNNPEVISEIKDTKKVLEVFKLVINNEINFQTFRDHINFYYNLNRFEPVKWSSYNKETFVDEHLYYTEKFEEYSKGIYFRKYSNNFIELFNDSLFCDGMEFKPVLLTDSKSYIEESATQSNCVKGYVNRASSFIISLRNENENERATIEYSIFRNPNTNVVKVNRVQSLGRFNNSLSDEWKTPLEKLDDRINNYFTNNEFVLPEIKIVFKSGFENETKAVFNESRTHPCWENEYFDATMKYFNGTINLI